MLELSSAEIYVIRSLNVLEHNDFPIFPGKWLKYLPKEFDRLSVSNWLLKREAISRKSIVDGFSGLDLCTEDVARDLFLSVMMWGYASDNRGPSRTSQMLDSADEQDFRFGEVCRNLINSNVEASYKLFATGMTTKPHTLKWCGPAFFTKYLYFVSKIANSTQMCVIFDAVVARAVVYRLSPNLPLLPIDVTPATDFSRYAFFLKVLQGVCKEIGDDCQPDQVELFFFKDQIARSNAKSAQDELTENQIGMSKQS